MSALILQSVIEIGGGIWNAYGSYQESQFTWAAAYSLAAVGGTYGLYKGIKMMKCGQAGYENATSPFTIVNGSIIYASSLKNFSKSWKKNTVDCGLSVMSATFGVYCAVSNLESLCSSDTSLSTVQHLYELAAILTGGFYLLQLKNHQDKILYITFFLLGIDKIQELIMDLLRIKTNYEQDHPEIVPYLNMLVGGPFVCLHSIAVTKIMNSLYMMPIFIISMGIGLSIVMESTYVLYRSIPPLEFRLSVYRTLGPVGVVFSCFAAGYLYHFMSRRSAVFSMPVFICGLYFTYKGFMKDNNHVDSA